MRGESVNPPTYDVHVCIQYGNMKCDVRQTTFSNAEEKLVVSMTPTEKANP